jgi:hypothetical protein
VYWGSLLTPTALASPGLASSILPKVDAALNYPNSSEQFFREGRQQFEQEIQRLTDMSATTTEVLHIDESLPTTLEQQRLQLEQQRLQLEQPGGRDGNMPHY